MLPDRADRALPAARTKPAAPAAANPIPPAYAPSRLSVLMPEDAIAVEDAPSHRPAIQQFLSMRGADSFYAPPSVWPWRGRATASCARSGDGSTMYSTQAIWTAAQHGLPITFVVMNSSGHGAMRALSLIMQVHRPPRIDLPGLDFVRLAKGLVAQATA
ncbi:thiamine pyrophosphate-dependent enzyme [Bradyrhizobium sp. 48]|nr:thiamine pyrophosphate-dependent enzyme [Bradyrhizobium sp. 48]